MKPIILSAYLLDRRFRRKLRKKAWKKSRRRNIIKEAQSEPVKVGKSLKNFSDAVLNFMPINLLYLVTRCKKSPFYSESRKNGSKNNKVVFLPVPAVFSIIDNDVESVAFLQDLVSILYTQNCHELWLDYSHCVKCDLATQVYLDSILKDYDKFIRKCKQAHILDKKHIGINIASLGGRNINDEKLQRMINSVGSPVILLGRQIRFKNIITYKLRHFDGSHCTESVKNGQKEIDTTTLIQYVIDSLNRFNRDLSREAQQELGIVTGETIANAEEHSNLKNRYLVGYFEESEDTSKHYGLLNLVIMNYGKTIYEKFKYPEDNEPFNVDCRNKMLDLSNRFKSKLLKFRK